VNRNVEIKARAHDPVVQRERAAKRADGAPERIEQVDTFYCMPDRRARLKLREFADGSAELIGYTRPDTSEPALSSYALAPLADPQAVASALGQALGVRAVVRKVRTLFLAGQTRIHFDDVESLGAFIELEVVLESGQSQAEGEAVARAWMRELDIRPQDLVDVAYVDLLEGQGD
jgi:adenylate cyclase class IV